MSRSSTRPVARERLDLAVLSLARLLPLVVAQGEQSRECFGVRANRFGVGQRLELLGGREQQLLDDQVRDLVDTGARLGREGRQLEVQAIELRAADGFESLAQRDDGRDGASRTQPGGELL